MAKVLRNHYSQLSYAIENNLQVIANEMYSKELISREVRKAPTLEKIEIEFLVITSLYKDDIHCKNRLVALTKKSLFQ